MNLLAQKESKPLFHVYDIESDKTTNSKTLEYFEKIRNFSILQPKKHDNRSFGNCLCLFFYKGEPLISIGPHWYLFLFMWIGGFILQRFFNTFVLKIINRNNESFLLTPFVSYLALISYAITALKNPGIYKRNMVVNEEIVEKGGREDKHLYCLKCRVIKKNSIYHCEDCDVCIIDHDHHCPWTSKCIGKGNIRTFYWFIISTFGYFIMIIIDIFMLF